MKSYFRSGQAALVMGAVSLLPAVTQSHAVSPIPVTAANQKAVDAGLETYAAAEWKAISQPKETKTCSVGDNIMRNSTDGLTLTEIGTDKQGRPAAEFTLTSKDLDHFDDNGRPLEARRAVVVQEGQTVSFGIPGHVLQLTVSQIANNKIVASGGMVKTDQEVAKDHGLPIDFVASTRAQMMAVARAGVADGGPSMAHVGSNGFVAVAFKKNGGPISMAAADTRGHVFTNGIQNSKSQSEMFRSMLELAGGEALTPEDRVSSEMAPKKRNSAWFKATPKEAPTDITELSGHSNCNHGDVTANQKQI